LEYGLGGSERKGGIAWVVVADLGWELGRVFIGGLLEGTRKFCGVRSGRWFWSIRGTVGLARWIGIGGKGRGEGVLTRIGDVAESAESRGFCACSTATWAGLDQTRQARGPTQLGQPVIEELGQLVDQMNESDEIGNMSLFYCYILGLV